MERLIGVGLAIAFVGSAYAHDAKRPDLDNWYAHLHRQGGMGMCCDKMDCHKTDAEVRQDGHWWARLGHPRKQDDLNKHDDDWILDGWREIKDEVIVRDENGKIVANPEGEAVICHERSWDQHAGAFTTVSTPQSVIIFCFVPQAQG